MTNRADRIHAGAMIFVAALSFAGWTLYWTTRLFVDDAHPFYNLYEQTFTLADVVMGALFLGSALSLLKGRVLAVPLGIAAGGQMTFLLCMDVLFNLQQGLYAPVTPLVTFEIFINALCLAFGPFTAVRLWRRRMALEHRPSSASPLSASTHRP